jgi:8-oxo-dGTP pyrophosphatase MutT (NUDIX family)
MAHIHEKIDFTASAYIVHSGKILLRMHDKYNIWLGVGGHVELDEDPIQALYREVKEECGLQISLLAGDVIKLSDGVLDLPVPDFLIRVVVEQGHEHIDLGFIATAKTLDINPAPGEKKVEFKWFSAADLEDPKLQVIEHVKQHALKAIRTASSKS